MKTHENTYDNKISYFFNNIAMSWLKNNAFINNANRQCPQNIPTNITDRSACYDSFCKHWQQAHDIIKQSFLTTNESIHDYLVAFNNHIDQMVTLLIIEFRNNTIFKNCHLTVQSNLLCLEYLLSENLLDIVYDWSAVTRSNTVDLKVIKLFELLISYNASIIGHEPILRPLLKLLKSYENDVLSPDLETELINLLHSICVALTLNSTLVDVFFCSSKDDSKRKFLILILLLPFIHREGTIGQKARDAMLLFISLSQKNFEMADYLSENSNVCPILATGISGLYSLLPRKLDIPNEDWCRLTPENVCNISSLHHLIRCLEFCNAVARLSHISVQKKLSEYLYQGFLVSVLGPALLQTSLDEAITATIYLELFLHKVTNPGLLYTIIKFLLESNYDGYRILDVLIQRIASNSKLCIVTLALFETLVDLNNEDIMLELCFSSLSPCSHVMLSQRSKLQDLDFSGNTAKKILSLRPTCCLSWTNFVENKYESTNSNISCENSESFMSPMLSFCSQLDDSLIGNYFAYLYNARTQIILCRLSCSSWSSKYDGNDNNSEKNNFYNEEKKAEVYFEKRELFSSTDDIIDNVKSLIDHNHSSYIDYNNQENSLNALEEILDSENKNNESFALELSDTFTDRLYIDDNNKPDNINAKEFIQCNSNCDKLPVQNSMELDVTDAQFKQPILSSNNNNNNINNNNNNIIHNHKNNKNSNEKSTNKNNSLMIYNTSINDEDTISKPSVGKFLDVILKKLEFMTSNNLYVNLRLTGLISRLAIYQQPLLQSFLLNPSLVFQPSIRSLFQILASLKHKIDQYLSKVKNVEELVYQARCFLRNRESQLINDHQTVSLSSIKQLSATKRNLNSDPFDRNRPKRKSLTSHLTQIFKLGVNGVPQYPRANSTTYSNENNYSHGCPESMMSIISTTQHVVLCAVIVDEWLKELSAITQEHCILSLDI